jgi:hypothetical protein
MTSMSEVSEEGRAQYEAWQEELERLRAEQEKRPTFERHMQIDQATRMAYAARVKKDRA